MPKLRCALAVLWLLLGNEVSRSWAASDSPVRPADSYIIDKWSTEDGLPQNEVTSILQARDGYLWLGTLSGLVRFDGVRFTVYDEGNTPGLNSSRIISLFEDSRHSLWVGTEAAGVVLMKEGQVIDLSRGHKTLEGRLASACEDPAGAVWLYMSSGQLWRCQNGKADLFGVGADLPTDYRGVILEKSGPLWVGTDKRLFAIGWHASATAPTLSVQQTNFVGKLDLLLASRQGGYWRLSDGRVQKWTTNGCESVWDYYPWYSSQNTDLKAACACEDRQGNLIVGTSGSGLYWFDAKGVASCIATNQGLSGNHILSLQVDLEGDLWVGTDGGGLNRLRRATFDGLEESRGLVTQSVAEDDQGGLWIGYNSPTVGAYFKESILRSFRLPTRTVFVDKSQRVWVGNKALLGSGLSLIHDGTLQSVPGLESLSYVTAIYQDRRGWLWAGSQQGLARRDENQQWTIYTTTNGLSSDVVQAIADDADGNVWIGTAGGGLDCWHDGTFTTFRKSSGNLPSDTITSLYADGEGVLWIGTDGGGLVRFQKGQWTRYTRRDGLVSNTIGYFIEDGQGYLWLGSNAGLMRIPLRALNDFAAGQTNLLPCRVYGKRDGLPTSECTMGSQPGPCRTKEGKLWFPTIKGLASVNPAALKPNRQAPPVRIEAVLLGGRAQPMSGPELGPGGSLVIPPRKEGLEIQYTSLNLSAPERTRFKFWLEGHEKTWTEAGGSRVARYPILPPGSYRFHVTACNEDGEWNPTGTSLALTVLPPFWRTGWFLGTAAALLLGAIAAVVYYISTQKLQRQLATLKQQETLERERSRIARDIHDQLGASLTQVALLGELVESDKDAPNEVEAHARQISQTARDTTRVLDEIVWAVNPSNDTLDGLMTYVCKYAQEYLAVAGVHYRLEVPSQLPNTPIPPEVRHNVFLVCKEAVTNIVRHAKASEVHLRLRFNQDACEFELQDNGRGLIGLDEKAAQTRNGLRNMRARMESIGGQFTLGPAPGGGALVRLTVPLGRQIH